MNVASRLPDSAAAALAHRPATSAKPPFLGFGLGLRHQHYDDILGGSPPIDWMTPLALLFTTMEPPVDTIFTAAVVAPPSPFTVPLTLMVSNMLDD